MSLFKAASTVSLLTLASRVTGLVRELLMASAFGASAMTDAFNVAWRIPNLFRRLFAEGAFSQAFVPVLAASKEGAGEVATQALIAKVASVLTAALLVTCVAGVIGAPLLVWLMASGLKQSAESYGAAVWMTRLMFPYIGFMSLVALASGVLNTWKRFAIPAFTPVLLNLCWIVAAWWGAPWFRAHGIEPIYALCAGVMIGGLLQLAVQLRALAGLGLLPRLSLSAPALREAWADAGVRRVAALMAPALLGVGVAQVSLVINTQIASYLAPGSVSWISYADRLMEFPTALLGVALGVVLMPQLAAANQAGDEARYSALLDWGLRLMIVFTVHCAAALLVFGQPLVAVLYHYGRFSAHDVAQTVEPLIGWGVGLVGLVAIKVLAPGYFAKQDVRTPVKIAIVVLVLTQVFNAILVPRLAHAALTLSIGLGALINALWMLIGLLQRGRYRPGAGWWKLLLQVVAATALVVVFLMWAGNAVPWLNMPGQAVQRIGLLLAVIGAAIVIYFAALAAAGMSLRSLLRR